MAIYTSFNGLCHPSASFNDDLIFLLLMKNKSLFHEILWLIACLIFTIAINFALLGKSVFEKDIDINLHDTYFIVKDQHILIWSFIVFSFILYFIKEKRQAFSRKLPYAIFLVLGLTFSILIMKAAPIVSFFNPRQSGWTVYPPLQAKVKPEVSPINEFVATFLTPFNGLLLLEVLVITLLLWATYRYAKSRIN